MATAYDQTAMPTEANDFSINTEASGCKSNFSRSIEFMESKDEVQSAYVLRKLQTKFLDSMGYLGVFAEGSASLDHRLRHHPEHHTLVILALDMLNTNLLNTMTTATDSDDDDVETDGSSDNDLDRRRIEFSWILKSINHLNQLAIRVREIYTSPLDSRVQAFGARKTEEISPFEVKAILAVKALYPMASHSIRERICKSMTRRYTRLLYWKAHDKKLCVGNNHQRQMPLESTHVTSNQPVQQHRSRKEYDSDSTNPKASKIPQPGTLLSETIPLTTGYNPRKRPVGGATPVRKRARVSTVLGSKAQFPSPPQFEDGEDRKPCPLCQELFFKANFEDIGWWTHHVNKDLTPFDCIFGTCSIHLSFASRTDWMVHMETEHGEFWPQKSLKNTQIHAHQTALQDFNERLELRLLDCTGGDSRILTAGDKKLEKSVRFGVTNEPSITNQEESPPSDVMEAEGTDEKEPQRSANFLTMLHHIADHLQFLAILTPRLSVEKLSTGEQHKFYSDGSSTNSTLGERRSTLDDDFEET
ncbi:hypothetical protein F5Y10DRAFT_291785 [Nemania abortiva]|nr:hypothetical protein F5Y10DRAFT_291785 [Nemania abortiva]